MPTLRSSQIPGSAEEVQPMLFSESASTTAVSSTPFTLALLPSCESKSCDFLLWISNCWHVLDLYPKTPHFLQPFDPWSRVPRILCQQLNEYYQTCCCKCCQDRRSYRIASLFIFYRVMEIPVVVTSLMWTITIKFLLAQQALRGLMAPQDLRWETRLFLKHHSYPFVSGTVPLLLDSSNKSLVM